MFCCRAACVLLILIASSDVAEAAPLSTSTPSWDAAASEQSTFGGASAPALLPSDDRLLVIGSWALEETDWHATPGTAIGPSADSPPLAIAATGRNRTQDRAPLFSTLTGSQPHWMATESRNQPYSEGFMPPRVLDAPQDIDRTPTSLQAQVAEARWRATTSPAPERPAEEGSYLTFVREAYQFLRANREWILLIAIACATGLIFASRAPAARR